MPLPRQPTDAEWERLVADLRRTFAARGRIDTHGSLRLWSNGNLHASIEPGEDGPVLRMGTLKGNARQLMLLGGPMMLAGFVFMLIFVLGLAANPDWLEVGTILSLAGAGMLGYGAIPLHGWARERRRQMKGIGERLLAGLAADSDSAD